MNSITIILEGRIPSKKNSKRRIKRGNNIFMVPSEAHEVWWEEQMYKLNQHPSKGIKLESIESMVIHFYPPDNRKGDMSNKAESIMDLLVDAQILEDDNWFVVPDLHLKFGGVQKEFPRAIVNISLKS